MPSLLEKACAPRLLSLPLSQNIWTPRYCLDSGLHCINEVAGTEKFFEGKGCSKCNNTGYLGRIAILETMLMDEQIREMVNKCDSEENIKRYLQTTSFKNLRENAITYFCRGTTTLEEVFRMT